MEGWRPVEDIVRWGFGQAPVVMANEFHSGLARCVRTRVIGARMIRAAHEAAPGEPMLVWSGNSHASKHHPPGCDDDEWIPMGWNFRELSGLDPFVIDQTVTVNFSGRPPGHARELLEFLADTLADLGGTAGILRAQAPLPLDQQTGVDALIVSTDNELTGPLPAKSGPAETPLAEDGA